VGPSAECGTGRKLTTISATRSASRLPVRRKNGTPAQRQFSISAFSATNVSVVLCGFTPCSVA
jgi:hypothetical protein